MWRYSTQVGRRIKEWGFWSLWGGSFLRAFSALGLSAVRCCWETIAVVTTLPSNSWVVRVRRNAFYWLHLIFFHLHSSIFLLGRTTGWLKWEVQNAFAITLPNCHHFLSQEIPNAFVDFLGKWPLRKSEVSPQKSPPTEPQPHLVWINNRHTSHRSTRRFCLHCFSVPALAPHYLEVTLPGQVIFFNSK